MKGRGNGGEDIDDEFEGREISLRGKTPLLLSHFEKINKI